MRAVDAHADVAGLAQVVEDGLVLALAVLDQRRQDHDAAALRQRQDGVDDLLHRLLRDLAAALGAVGVADAGEEQAQVVVDLGDGAHGRARVAAGALLVDGDGGREALDVVDVRLLHLAQELAGVGGERLDVAALALRRRWCRRPGELLPEPETPVMTTSLSRGMSTSMFLRLCSRAPLTTMESSGMGLPLGVG